MNFLDGALFPENQDELVITAAPYGPEWLPSDFPEDIAVSMEDQIQKAVDCYNAGATVLQAARIANYAGGIVVMKRGTATVSREELAAAIRSDKNEECAASGSD